MAATQNSMASLPHELLGEVFTQYASVCPDAPIVLGSVSRLFRHIAYTTPSVWSHLALSDTDGGKKPELWFKMSKACQIEVQVHMAPASRAEHGADAPAVKVPEALKTLRLHTDCIRALCLRTDTQAQARAALSAIYSDIGPTGTTALLSLRIIVASAAQASPLPALPTIPSITDLETTNVALAALPSLNLERLQSLRLLQPLVSPPMATEDILDLIHFAPFLRRLRVEARIADPATAATSDMRFVPQLSELHLRVNNIVALLDRFIVPSLHVLHLSDLDGKRANASEEMGTALHRLLVRMELGKGDVKSNELRVFELMGVEVERGNSVWERCVQRMKALEIFSVDSPGDVQDDMSSVDSESEETTTRPIKAAFVFGFGAAETTASVFASRP
ncbi:hypothetical protein C8R43DRAFT_1023712 [Mycena crocata]|nr:hypothetical protein C8R43DRAFT_1023712 [Mycena crocata]